MSHRRKEKLQKTIDRDAKILENMLFQLKNRRSQLRKEINELDKMISALSNKLQ